MINSIHLVNHESHRDTKLDFLPGLNVLIGPSDAGKSGAFRAAYWTMFNRPLGDQMLPLYWDGTTEVSLQFDDGQTVTRMKGKSCNHYRLNDNEPINAGNGAPPEAVQAVINMDDVNFQTQIDRAFLMFETPGERGRILNKIAGLDDIDRALDNSRSDELKLRQAMTAKKSELERLETELEQFADLEDREAAVKQLELFDQYARDAERKADRLVKTAEQYREVEADTIEAETLLEAENELKGLKTLVDEISALENRVGRLSRLTASLRRNNALADSLGKLDGAEVLLSAIRPLAEQIEKCESKAKKINRICWRLSIINQEIEAGEAEIKKIENGLPKNCPTCGAKTK